jgi:hypothetical protein
VMIYLVAEFFELLLDLRIGLTHAEINHARHGLSTKLSQL